MKLPVGYYVVQNDSSSAFLYKGVAYKVEEGVNLFRTLHEAAVAASETPVDILEGLDYQEFDTPVILFSSGEHNIDKFYFDKGLTLLGQGAGITPNLAVEKIEERPEINPMRTTNESVLYGSYWFGRLTIPDSNIDFEKIVIDGFSWRDVRFVDERKEGSSTEYLFKNIIHLGPSGRNVYDFTPATEDSVLQREVCFENLRVCDFEDYTQGPNFILLNAKKAIFSGICYDNTELNFGLSNIGMSYPNYAANANATEIIIRDSYFANMKGYNGLSVSSTGIGEVSMTITIDNCDFYNAGRENQMAISARLENDNCSLKIQNCRFVAARGNRGAAIQISGTGTNISLSNNECEGYASEYATSAIPSVIPDYIDNQEGATNSEDTHKVLSFDESDFSAMHDIYEGTKAYYGDTHAHFKTDGGMNDGQTLLSDWTARMDEIGLDFAVLTDHQQRRGPFTEWWDESRFIIAAEPDIRVADLSGRVTAFASATTSEIHTNMIFPDKDAHAKVMAEFPEFNWRGDDMNGFLIYPDMTKARIEELAACVQSIGGLFVHAHPKQLMASKNPLDYYYGEYTYMDVLYVNYDSNFSSLNYELWVNLLNLGKRVYATTTTDTHYEVRNDVVSTIYAAERHGSLFFKIMKSGDYTAGAIGIKMLIDSTPMGSSVAYRKGQKLLVETGDFYEGEWKENTAYELRIYTDQGLAYSGIFNGSNPQNLVLEVQDRMYYRAEVVDLTRGYRVAVSNPIWLD